MSIFAARLKEARVAAALSQEKLGVLAGIDEASSSARMNQYERGKHDPDFSMVERIAKVLNLPEAYFYTKDDDIAVAIMLIHRMNKTDKRRVVELIRGMVC